MHAIHHLERINYVLFKEQGKEIIRRGFEFKYIPKRMHLTVMIRCRQLVNEVELVESFAIRLPANEWVIDNCWPLHSTTKVFGSSIHCINAIC